MRSNGDQAERLSCNSDCRKAAIRDTTELHWVSPSNSSAFDAKPADMKGLEKPPLVMTDYTSARRVDQSGVGAWTFKPDQAPATDKLPAVRIPLKHVNLGVRVRQVLLLPSEKKAFVVFFDPFQSHLYQVQACNLQSGQVETTATFGKGEGPIAISPDGTLVLAKVEDEWERGSELRLYSREGTKLKPLKAWKPFVTPSEPESDGSQVRWAEFTDSQHVLTSCYGDLTFVLWEVPSLKPVWLAAGDGANFLPGSKYLAMTTTPSKSLGSPAAQTTGATPIEAVEPTTNISIVEIASGTEVGHLSIGEHVHGGDVGMSPDGTRIAFGQPGRMRIWNLQTQEMVSDFAVQRGASPLPSVRTIWTSDHHLLVGLGYLVDADRRAPIWKYNFDEYFRFSNGKIWYPERIRVGDAMLVGMEVPHPAALASVANLKPEDLQLIHPGMEMTLDCQLTGKAEEVEAAKKTLEQRLQKNGMKLVPDSKTRLIATVEPGKTITIRYQPYRGVPLPSFAETGTQYQANTQVLALRLEVEGKMAWKYETTTRPPSFLRLGKDETVEQALDRSMKSQGDYLPRQCNTVWIPAYIARVPGDGDANNNPAPSGNQKSRISPAHGRET